MKLRSGLLGLTLTSVVALASANAADIYRAPAGGGYKDGPAYATVNWSGLYLGVNGGYGEDANSLDPGFSNPNGGFGGGQIGYNWQGMWHPNLVLGVEADIQGSGISATTLGIFKSELDWFGTVRGRLGYAFDRVLIYGTGGFAYGGVKNTFFPGETQTGWVAGGGVEYKFSPAWSAKAEYQFLSLDGTDASGAGRLGDAELGRTEVNTFRVGVNYFVGRGYEPLK
jgi:outer membrane immunogenic protein